MYHVVKSPNLHGVLSLLRDEYAHSDEHQERFLKEVRILSELHHPNLVKVTDFDRLADGTPFHVTELLVGRHLRDMLRASGSVEPRLAYSIGKQVLDALAVAHTHDVPIVHGSLSMDRLFVHALPESPPIIKVLGFGVAATADAVSYRYAAPERLRGEPLTAACDIYSVGVLLYELLAGQGPFDHHREGLSLIEAHLYEVPRSVADFAPRVAVSVERLIALALAKDPAARPADAREFAAHLEALSAQRDVRVRHDTLPDDPEASPRSTDQPVVLDYTFQEASPDEASVSRDEAFETASLLDGLEPYTRAPDFDEKTASRTFRGRARGRHPSGRVLTVALFAGGVAASAAILIRSPHGGPSEPQCDLEPLTAPAAATPSPAFDSAPSPDASALRFPATPDAGN